MRARVLFYHGAQLLRRPLNSRGSPWRVIESGAVKNPRHFGLGKIRIKLLLKLFTEVSFTGDLKLNVVDFCFNVRAPNLLEQ